jgi:hypothetical protein
VLLWGEIHLSVSSKQRLTFRGGVSYPSPSFPPSFPKLSRDVGDHESPRDVPIGSKVRRLKAVVSHISRKTSEIWGTPCFVDGKK